MYCILKRQSIMLDNVFYNMSRPPTISFHISAPTGGRGPPLGKHCQTVFIPSSLLQLSLLFIYNILLKIINKKTHLMRLLPPAVKSKKIPFYLNNIYRKRNLFREGTVWDGSPMWKAIFLPCSLIMICCNYWSSWPHGRDLFLSFVRQQQSVRLSVCPSFPPTLSLSLSDNPFRQMSSKYCKNIRSWSLLNWVLFNYSV